MYLSKLHIKGFRCIKETTVEFRRGLNVLIGENNCGKTSVADALRLVLATGSLTRDISLSMDDFYCDESGARADVVELDATFAEPTSVEQGIFIEMLAVTTPGLELQLHLRYNREVRGGVERWRFRSWGGEKEGQAIAPEVLQLFYYVYLGALRDAERDLSPSRGNRLGQLFTKLERDQAKQTQYAGDLQKKLDEDHNWVNLRRKAETKIKAHLDEVSFENSKHDVEIAFVPLEFRRIVESLQMRLRRPAGSAPTRVFEIDQNGLGYNNLLYIATVLGDLVERKNAEPETYVALLIEEPEAHLHPQLQDTLFNFLEEIAGKGIQILVTSHSPTVSAKTRLDTLSVLQAVGGSIAALPISKCPLVEDDRLYLERFLDVTKSQLLFARGVILVEGISEALLLPLLAGRTFNLDKRGIEVVSVAGTAFAPFAHLFNAKLESQRLSTRCAIVTDDDSHLSGDVTDRAKATLALEGGLLRVLAARKTFEHELWEAGNGSILAATYAELHQRTAVASAEELIAKLTSNRDKASLAQSLARKLDADALARAAFSVPAYIEKALNWVANGVEPRD